MPVIDAFKEIDERAGSLLRIMVPPAVWLTMHDMVKLYQLNPDIWWRQARERTKELAHTIAECGDALMFRIKNKTARVFNALVEGLAILSFAPGGVTFMDMKFDARELMPDGCEITLSEDDMILQDLIDLFSHINAR